MRLCGRLTAVRKVDGGEYEQYDEYDQYDGYDQTRPIGCAYG